MKKACIFCPIFVLLVTFSFAQNKRFQVSIFGGVNHILKYGSEDDYAPGENDFPVIPAHTPFNFGVSLMYSLTHSIGIELDGRYYLSSKVPLTDPSDQDTVEVNTSKHFSVSGNFIYQFTKNRFRPYLVVGGGINKISAKDETYTSEYGYDVELEAPPSKETIDPIVQAGTGIQYFIKPNFGARADFRYVLIFDNPNNINSLNCIFGIFYRF